MPTEGHVVSASEALCIGALVVSLHRASQAMKALTTLVAERARQDPQPAFVAPVVPGSGGEVPVTRFRKYPPPTFIRVEPFEDP